MQFHHVGIRVADLDASINWYRTAIAYSVERRFQLIDAGLDIAMLLATDGSRLELLAPMSSTASADFRAGEVHLCFQVRNVDDVARTLRARGASIVQRPKDIPAARVRNLWVEDHEGNLIEYIQPIP